MDEINDRLKPTGYIIVVKIFKTFSSMNTYEAYFDGIGIVRAMGPDCYKGEQFQDQKPWCAVNDIILCNLTYAHQVNVKNEGDFWIINDDKVKGVITPGLLWEMHEFKDNRRYDPMPMTSNMQSYIESVLREENNE